ncbi:hypothetical protein OGCDGJMD_01247 [Cyanobium usitatum str. Tous]|nr:hypothetical protein [Cyanobium usitatum]CAK6692511.1 hypothetical protein OGCDGJMD_01247 [Cyanobium usitatum str. Tous]
MTDQRFPDHLVEGLMTSEQENIKRIKDRGDRIKQLNKIFRKEVSSNG